MIDKAERVSISIEAHPPGWATSVIGDVIGYDGIFIDGDWVESKDQDPNGDVRLIQLADVGDGIYRNKSDRFLTHEKAIQLGCTFLQPNDLMIARMPDPLGRACIFPGDSKTSVTVVDVCIIRTGAYGADYKWLMYLINSLQFRSSIDSLQSGSTRKRISRGNLARIEFPLPPVPEQHRIVCKIEELFTRLDAGVEALKNIQIQLKRYRQSVLKAAFEGKLTAEWRKAHKGEREPASVLLERIKAERKKKLGNKYKELPPVDTSELPELPEGWEWVYVEQIADVGTGATPLKSKKEYYDQGKIPWITSGALNEEFVRKADEFITDLALKETNAKVFPVHTLLVALYGEGKTRGKVSELMIEAATNQACAALIFDGYASNLRPFIKSFFEKNYQDIRRLSSGGVQPNLNLGIIKATKVPIPPLSEQKEINEEIDRHFSITEEIEKSVEDSLKQSERMRQSILKQAFDGKLVPQDPHDEPAGKLLERIKAEKSKIKIKGKAKIG